jgi:hypothetical protein
MSIGKSQAAALADGFVDSIGGGKDSLQPKETLSVLFQIVGEIIERSQENLIRSNSNASGGLSKSIIAEDPESSAGTVTVNVTMDFYGQFINKGVRGTKSGAGLYAFKTPYPNRKMVAALMAGQGRAKSKTSNIKKTVSANERKNVSLSAMDKAYGAARNIKMYGIKATNFMDDAIAFGRSQIAARLGDALEIDILNSIVDGTNNNSNPGGTQ